MSAVSKVVFGNTTVIDITDSTVNANNLLSGEIAYGANGEQVEGSLVTTPVWTGTQAEYNQQSSQIDNGTIVNITDDYTGIDFFLEETETLSTSTTTSYTFVHAKITNSSVIDVYSSIFGVNPSNVVVTTGQCVVTFPIYTSAVSMTCRIYLK